MTDNDELLTVKQVADIFQVTTYTIRTWIGDDDVSLVGVKIGGQWRVYRSEVKRFLNEKREAALRK